MPRKLPWKLDGAVTAQQEPAKSTVSRTQATVDRVPGVHEDSARRSPSTSSPPALQVENFMIDGLDADDGYRMVEDEFLSVAGTFTAHLHKAEYHRLKSLTKNRNAETIQAISRPVVGNKTEAVRRRQAVAHLAARQRVGVKRAQGGDASDNDDNTEDGLQDPWAGTSLQGLMGSARTKAVPLSTMVKTSAGASAGRRQDAGTGHAPARGESCGMPSGPPAARGHIARVSSVNPDHTRKLSDNLHMADDSDDDLDAPSSFAPRQQNIGQHDTSVHTAKAKEAVSSPRRLVPPTTSEPEPSSWMRTPSTAPSAKDGMAAAPRGARTPVPHRPSSASPARGGPADDGSGSDDDRILQRIRERRRSRMAHVNRNLQKTAQELDTTGRDEQLAKKEDREAPLDFVPPFL